ncbi:MAG: N-acetylglucosamine-6-phosphate deacetylase [Oscillospiraceae bacterium]|jgi:N-acetylglucosamine-6-phosphate deacetylase|nr:N-acetylglucosamine-6-phosphate deacetylase [Oscillospiraceae bacterium]
MKYLYNADIVTPEGILRDSSVLYDGTVISVGETCPEGAEALDGQGLTLWPGLIDIHTHGYGGRDTMDGGNSVAEIAKGLPRYGVTAFLPTTVTGSREAVSAALEGVRSAMGGGEGAAVLGAHLEGPFLSPERLGAHDPRFILPPAADWLDAGVIKLVTVAPELSGAEAFIEVCRERGIQVSIGHTDASYELCEQAVGWGAASFTHTFNAMSPLTHRRPGAVGAALLLDCFAELICDNIHVVPAVQKIAFRLKPDRLILITDSIMAASLPDGSFTLGTVRGTVRNGVARLPDGTLAGSVLTMNTAVMNFMKNTGASAPQAARAACENPAALLGLRKGRIQPGYDADFVLFDREFEARLTVSRGRTVYAKNHPL